MNYHSENEIKDELILALLQLYIIPAINTYYNNYFNEELEVYDYENKILDIKRVNYLTVRIGVTPQIGAHNPVGYDRLTFSVGGDGTVKLQKYEHLASYEIPPHLKDLVIKPLPKIIQPRY